MITKKLFAVYNGKLESLEVVDKGGKKLRHLGHNSGLAFGCSRLFERGRYAENPAEAWTRFLIASRNAREDAHRSIDHFTKNIEAAKLELAKLGIEA